MRADEIDQPKAKDPLLRSLIGAALRRTRQRQGRTLADVAEAAGVSVPYLSEIERGRKEPSSEVLGAVCDALRIELVDLVAMVGRELVELRTSRVVVPIGSRKRRDRRRLRELPATDERPLEIARPLAPRQSGRGDITCLAA
ncbi:helix-turn-helix domain-containing protein [Microlunatus parietis]|uniref:Transcriptional regulator with XRE-family HTH domain n=1 Tax=Microlunatus parietis TaxID=682979 RepID=A0A7Y9I7H0_9ACTN|nr:helix-turn-helix transcriptional regulator [Microlunatus parietis]NYE71406.1 transcriptional regulator with XRE-family HTH domain [Microlunatus parietis]